MSAPFQLDDPALRVSRPPAGRRRRTRLLAAATGVLVLAASIAAPIPVAAEPAPEPIPPVFTNGEAQPVFPTGSANWINHELWVEAPFDSDGDGSFDRIHADVSRVRETDTEDLKVPVVMEASPYYAGSVNVRNWSVNHEIGFPPADRVVRSPSIQNTSPQISTAHEATWVPRGFAVMHVEGTGTGKSTGCPSVGGIYETLGPKAVIDWLNGRAKGYTTVDGDVEVTAYWHNGKSAMIGTSYNGTLPNAVASTGVEGLEAIVPISAISSWYDYYRANGMVRAPQTFQGEDLDVLGEYIYTRADQQICRQKAIYDLRLIQDRVTGDYNEHWDERNYMNDVDKVHAAVLVAHGNNDWNVMTKNAFQWYEALKARGVPHQLSYHTGGHGGSPPTQMLNRWFTHYLWGVENDVENDPIARIVRAADTCPDSARAAGPDQSNVTTIAVADSSRLNVGDTVTVQFTTATGGLSTTSRTITAIPDATHITVNTPVATGTNQRIVAGQIIYRCSTTFPSAYPEWPDPNTATATMTFQPNAPAVGELSFLSAPDAEESMIDNAAVSTSSAQELSLMGSASSPNRLAYRTPVLSSDVRISGTTIVNMRVKFSAAKANVTALLVAYPPTGNPFIVERGWIDPENRGGDYSVSEPMTPDTYYDLRFDMQGTDYIVAAGWRLGVVLKSSNGMSTVRPAAGLVMTVDLEHSSVELPIVGGAAAIATAMGVLAPTVEYTLDPATPNGANGWYGSGDVDLAWQVNETGAATSTVGCADETFANDGVYTRSCIRANVVDTTSVDVTVNLDTTAPVVTLDNVVDNGTYHVGTEPVCTSSDATSGVASPSVLTKTTVSGGPVVGYFTASCSAATDVAGHASTVPSSATYRIVYDFGGFDGSIKAGTNTPKAGSAIPINFSLAGDQGMAVLAAGSPRYQQTDCGSGATIGGSSSIPTNGGLQYDAATGLYTLVWKTDKSQANTCGALTVDFVDGLSYSAAFAFTK
jgi:predicted acyl esterase